MYVTKADVKLLRIILVRYTTFSITSDYYSN